MRGTLIGIGLVCGGLLLPAGEPSADALPPLPDYVVDTGRHVHGSDFVWLDDHRLLLLDGPGPAEHRIDVPYRMEIYDIRTRRAEPYRTGAEGEIYQQLCFDGTAIHYQVIRDDRVTIHSGPLGRERPTELPMPEEEGDAPPLPNPITCRMDVPPPALEPVQDYFPLRDGHGFITLSGDPGGRDTQVRLHRPGADPVPLPQAVGAMLTDTVQWAGWREAYLFQSGGTDRPCKEVYWLRPDGTTERHCIHDRHVWLVVATRVGLMYQRWDSDAGDLPGRDLAFFHDAPAGRRQVLPGWIGVARVSPDGCRIAFYSPYVSFLRAKGEDAPYMLHYVDVCESRDRFRAAR